MTNPQLEYIRARLRLLVKVYDPVDIVSMLSTVLTEESPIYARKTGDYARASRMSRLSDALDRLEDSWDD